MNISVSEKCAESGARWMSEHQRSPVSFFVKTNRRMAEDTKEPNFVTMDETDNGKNSSNASIAMEDVSFLTDPLAPSSSLSPETGDFDSTVIFPRKYLQSSLFQFSIVS